MLLYRAADNGYSVTNLAPPRISLPRALGADTQGLASMTTPTEYSRYWTVDERPGKRRRTAYKLSRENAARQFPGAQADVRSREVRLLPDELHGNTRPLSESP